jgi:hypothetical protein
MIPALRELPKEALSQDRRLSSQAIAVSSKASK